MLTHIEPDMASLRPYTRMWIPEVRKPFALYLHDLSRRSGVVDVLKEIRERSIQELVLHCDLLPLC